MYNDFIIIGPKDDPASIKGSRNVAFALQTIKAKSAPFISRGDNSGTHIAEIKLWKDTGLEPRTTPIESPQSNGMAEAFVRTIKRDYVHVSPCPDAQTVMHQLSAWINHYNEVHPHKALGYRSPREFIAAHGSS
jgi:putative transposase